MSEVDRDALTFIADEFRDQVADEMDNEVQQKYEERFYEHIRDDKYDELEQTLDEIEDEYGASMSSVRQFAEMATEEDLIEATEQEQVEAELSDGLAQAIKMQVKQKKGEEMIVRTDESVRIGDLFSMQDQLYEDHDKKAFVISDQRTWKGRVSVELSSTKEKIQLLRVYQGENGFAFKHLGESNTQYKGMKVIDEHTHGFFTYKFESDDKEYILFSTESLDPMTCDVHGMHLKLSDYKQFGENTGLPIDKDIIFAHSVEPSIKELDQDELERIVDDVDHEWLAERLLGDWRHPDWFEKLLLVMDMVNEEHGFPSGMLWMASPGTGKSVTLKAISDAHDEKQGVHTGSASTIKGLTPSFADSPPDEGFLLKTTRVSAIDEVFNLLSSARNTQNTNMKDAFRPLLDLVEHQDRTFSSGNGSIRGKMESIMIGAGNDSYGIGSMYDAADNLDNAFLSRFLLYEQTPQHIDFIEKRKFEIDEQECSGPDGDPDFISMIDHLKSKVQVNVDRRKVRDIKKDLEGQVPSNFQDIYRSRYDHHIKNLVSGHSKYRSIISGSMDFEAKEEDYQFALDTLEILINSWSSKADLKDMSLQARPYYLRKDKRQVFEYIRENYPVEKKDIDEELDKNTGFQLNKLGDLDLVREIQGEYHPYFSDRIGDIEAYKKFKHINSDKEVQNDEF